MCPARESIRTRPLPPSFPTLPSSLLPTSNQAVVDRFYSRVLGDPQLGRFFQGVDMSKHTRKFLLFVTYVLGGAQRWGSRAAACCRHSPARLRLLPLTCPPARLQLLRLHACLPARAPRPAQF